MNRERLAWIVSLVLLAILAFSRPSSSAQRDDDYSFVRTLIDIHRQVSSNYVDSVNEEKLREGAIDGMLGQLDPFSIYVPQDKREGFDNLLDGSFKGVGIQLNQNDDGKIEVVSPIEDSPAFKAGVKAGDIILKVDGKSIDNMKLPDVIKTIGGKIGTPVTLTVHHTSGDDADLTMDRDEIVVPTLKGFERMQNDQWDYWVVEKPKIAYLRLTQFTPDCYKAVHDVLAGKPAENGQPAGPGLLDQGMKGLILDLRFNPGGRLDEAVKLVDLFVDHGTIVSVKGRNRPEDIKVAHSEGTLPNFPMIVLVNEHSASAAEIMSGSLLDNHRALVLGERTYGKGSVQELIPLDGKSGELKLTVAYYYLPSGRLVHRKKDATDWGVEPQIIVPMDDATEKKVMEERYEQELFKKPLPKTATHPTTRAIAATTQPIDTQLQQAVTTMIGLVVLNNNPTTVPATQPAP